MISAELKMSLVSNQLPMLDIRPMTYACNLDLHLISFYQHFFFFLYSDTKMLKQLIILLIQLQKVARSHSHC